MKEAPIFELKEVCKAYPEFHLNHVSLSLPRGYIMGLIGPNGAGKSTTLQILMNLLPHDSGSVRVMQMEYPRDERSIKDRVGYVGEVQYFYENQSVRWMGQFASGFFSEWDAPLFSRYLERFDISPTKKARQLSKGTRVKLSLAIALSHHPELLVLDEPMSGLDPVVRRDLLGVFLDTIQDEKKSVLFSTHITSDVERIADFVAFLVEGKIVISAQKDSLLANYKRVHFADGAIPDPLVAQLKGLRQSLFGNAGITTCFETLRPELEALMANGKVKVENLNLDDILVGLVKGWSA
ncbi:MAG TPA: ABC transporter ATP-binding protein [Thermotogota bacterium]|nr:ABC transporter ATP-binding protein [Thermotogota bacterium]HRW92744.1 ABC transporter ATP-binding protein [Thermotogota bacterium]